ncbi:unnamed protein product [Caenorhabditis nigoni]
MNIFNEREARKVAPEKKEENQKSTTALCKRMSVQSVKFNMISSPYLLFEVLLLAEILHRLLLPHLDHHRKRQKLTKGEASTPFQPAQLHRKGNI